MFLITRHLSLSALISIALHGLALLGLVAVTDLKILPILKPTLDVTLAQDQSKQAVSQATLLAPSSQWGAVNQTEGESAGLQPQHVPVISTQAKAQYHIARQYADEAVLAHYAHHSKRRVISASTHESRDAQYLAYWRDIVEQEGTHQYRDNPKVRDHQGELRVLVAIAADGRLAEVKIRASSGDPALDNLAIDIVKSAAPFKPLPPDMTRDTDILEIIRTWRFTHEGQLVSTR